MLTFKTFISEEYYNSIKRSGRILDFYHNPTKKELKEINDYVRFVLNLKTHDIWCWDASTLIHNEFMKSFKEFQFLNSDTYKSEDDFLMKYYKEWFFGTELDNEIISDLLSYLTPNEYVYEILDYYDSYDWSWVDKYLPSASRYINNLLISLRKRNDRVYKRKI